MTNTRIALKRIVKLLLAFVILANAGMSAATKIMIATHSVIVKAGETYDGIQYPIGTEVSLTDIGNVVGNVRLSQDFKMNGHVIKEGTRLYMSRGKLSCYTTKQGQAIGAIVLQEGAQVCFENTGELKMIHLDRPNNILGHPFAANAWIQFHPGGKVAKGILAEDVSKAGLVLAGGSTITFHPSGSIDSAAIKPGAIFEKLQLGKRPNYDADVSFWPNGKLKEAVLAHPASIGKASCASGDISFKESGALKYCVILQTNEQLAAAAAQQELTVMANANLLRATVNTPGVVSLIAGTLEIPGKAGSDAQESASIDGVGSAARFVEPTALVADSAGNLFLTESGASHLVRKISTRGVVTTIAGIAGTKGAGYRNGAASSARFQDPAGIAIGKDGDLYVADMGNNVIRKISSKGVVSTFSGNPAHPGFVDGPRHAASLRWPTGIAFDKAGNLYVSHLASSALRRIDRSGAIATYAGSESDGYSMDGSRKTARFASIDKMAFDNAGNLFVGDMKLLRKISSTGTVSTLGNYADSYKELAHVPEVLLVDTDGNLYFALNSTIRRLTPAGVLSTVAGVAGQPGNTLGEMSVLENPRALVMLGPKTFAFISGNAVLKLVLP
jgi:sugar lactone lactonase YvrE